MNTIKVPRKDGSEWKVIIKEDINVPNEMDALMDDWIKMGVALGLPYVNIYAPNLGEKPLAVTFSPNDETYQMYLESLGKSNA